MSRRLVAPALAALALALTPAAASAAFPGPNGPVLFTAGAEATGGPDVFSYASAGGAVSLTDLAGGTGTGEDPAASADGTTIAFAVGEGAGSEIWTMGADGTNPRRLTDNAFPDAEPSFSQDGTRIAFTTVRPPGGDADVWLMDADGSNQHPLLEAPGEDGDPQFAPAAAEGLPSEAVFTSSTIEGDLDIAIVPAAGGPHSTPTPLNPDDSANPLDELEPSVRPDGPRVAYTRTGGGQADLQDAFFNGTDEFSIAATAADERHPSYSPDGTGLAYARDGSIVVAAAGGANPTPLVLPGLVSVREPEWAPAIRGATPDTTPPQTELTRKPRRRSSNRRVRFAFGASEQGSTFECRLDRKRFAPCESPHRTGRLARGRHRFEVRAVDAAGNKDPTPAKARFRVIKRSG